MPEFPIPRILPKSNPNLAYFGYAAIDVPGQTYSSEVSGFTNLNHMVANSVTEDLTERLRRFQRYKMKAALHIQDIFFDFVEDSEVPSGYNYFLRPDAEDRWNEWLEKSNISNLLDAVGCFYIFDEPVWNALDFNDLDAVSAAVYDKFPEIPIMLIEAGSGVEGLQIPATVSWVGFNNYTILDPLNQTEYLSIHQALVAKMAPYQKIVVVGEGQWVDIYENSQIIEREVMASIAVNYWNFANAETLTVALLFYTWQGGIDPGLHIGVRDLPFEVTRTHKDIGEVAIKGEMPPPVDTGRIDAVL